MKVATTIQINPAQEREVNRLKKMLRLPSKKAVILEGLKTLREIADDRLQAMRLQRASLAIRRESAKTNREWAPRSMALKAR